MPTYIFFLGRQLQLCQTELVAAALLHGLSAPRWHGALAIVQSPAPLPERFIDSLGGTYRIAEQIGQFSEPPSVQQILDVLSPLPPKWVMGITDKTLAMNIKKESRARGSRVSFVLPAHGKTHLNAAQVLFNKLHQPPNAELAVIEVDGSYLLTRTIQIQDIAAYERRDTARPARNSRSGMLPPKLAQMMLNIAVGHLPNDLRQSPIHILDPFCGSGVIIQEGWLSGHAMAGSDTNEIAIRFTRKNLDWLVQHFSVNLQLTPEISVHDATRNYPSAWRERFAAIVTEPYLGPALHSALSGAAATKRLRDLDKLYYAAFQNFYPILKPKGIIVFVLPVFTTPAGAVTIPQTAIDGIERIGYRLLKLSSPAEASAKVGGRARETLLYARPRAFVARELTVWQKL